MAKRVTGLGRGLDALLPPDDLSKRLQQMKRGSTQGHDGSSGPGKPAGSPAEPAGKGAKSASAQKAEGKASIFEAGQKSLGTQIQELPLIAIQAASEQPRKHFDEVSISELAQSIFENGLLQPILVTPLREEELADDGIKYRVIAGERRFRACEVLKWQRIPAIVKAVSEVEQFELALIENIQREDLTPIDEARAYEHLLRISGLSQQEMARHLGKGRSALANSLRLLQLPSAVQQGLSEGVIRSGHAKALLAIKEPKTLLEAYERCVGESWSVRQAEHYSQQINEERRYAEESSDLTDLAQDVESSLSEGLQSNDISQELDVLESQLQQQSGSQTWADSEPEIPEDREDTETRAAQRSTSPGVAPATPAAASGSSARRENVRNARPVADETAAPGEPEYWSVSGMLFRQEELEEHLAKALRLDLSLRLEGNLNEAAGRAGSGKAARPRKALLQVEFANQKQWEELLQRLGLKEALDEGITADFGSENKGKPESNALFS